MFSFMYSIIKIMFKFAPVQSGVKIISALVSACMPPLILLFTQNVLNGIGPFMNKTAGSADMVVWIAALTGALLMPACFTLIDGLLDISFKQKLATGFARSILDKYGRIAYRCFEDSEIQNTFEKMGSAPQDKILDSFYNGIQAVQLMITVFGLAVLFAQIRWLAAGIFFLLLALILFFDYRAMDMMNTMFNTQTTDERKMHYYGGLLSDKNTLFELRVFSAVRYIQTLWKRTADQVLSSRLRVTLKAQAFSFASTLCLLSWVAYILFMLIRGIMQSSLSPGVCIALLGSAASVLSYTETLSDTFSCISQNYLHLRDHYRTFTALPEQVSGTQTLEHSEAVITFDHVSFTYPKAANKTLDDISFTLARGERLALVGANGAGKSTIVKLLCRLYEPDSGAILIGNKNIRDISDEALHKTISAVFQDFVSYSLTVRENVAAGDTEKLHNDQALLSALERAHAADFIDNLDMPLGKMTENGVDLSGGQWQRIAMARALISASPFIILDEPAASLDPIAESALYNDFIALMNKQGCLIISHRLASAKQADKIAVIDRGRLVESGSHEQLLQKGGLYAQMWNTQSSWYKE